ncbi:hypothetical protein AAZX31_11G247300 [Glycine max]|uniref:RING-type E3 ubiquitin transferase n=2 Tax=Glycine subgen. Soja TaxID=1462606 RepID=I1LNH1_SOYBN|nr:E3 ubiquitin-protein ligase ATL6 [Glycine max]XP_028196792.1 E3 ubiquitin-protein ligase ATL6-like [Glycine soja]KAG5146946.1 hypothetical protein JHK84_032489 [Glycine max]KAH1160623.1 hypothetical protein GYH30_032089 [Glycine max]KHN44365.1 E3 ubiquitin-protein ligase ATL6 [Glycine soja]KRH31340.1 hypothetical protein GLYMA_11G242800v4 [Glycine max]RZB73204.1 E3 ubiquitin-protein ligase ATL6 [Glycine soja]|eukprot:XP_006591813.1 E3 ubiquitin-protein ligase ATL6 [Glycine max]
MEVTQYTFLVVLVWSSLCTNAQWNNPINYSPFDEINKGENSKVTWSVSLSCVFISILVFVLFKLRACCCSSSGRRNTTKLVAAATETIEKCPVFEYSTAKELKVGNGTEECAVCLVEFEDSDTIKMLPKCQHVFHQHCIDTWLPSRMTCPICRQKLTSEDNTVIDVVDVVVPTEQQEHDDTESTESEVAVTAAEEQPQPDETAEHETDTDHSTVVEQVVEFEVVA